MLKYLASCSGFLKGSLQMIASSERSTPAWNTEALCTYFVCEELVTRDWRGSKEVVTKEWRGSEEQSEEGEKNGVPDFNFENAVTLGLHLYSNYELKCKWISEWQNWLLLIRFILSFYLVYDFIFFCSDKKVYDFSDVPLSADVSVSGHCRCDGLIMWSIMPALSSIAWWMLNRE